VQIERPNLPVIEGKAETLLPTEFGPVRLVVYHAAGSTDDHLALIVGDVAMQSDVLVRLHSECITGDLLGSLRCDCGEQFTQSRRLIHENGRGVLLYLRQEGRGIGLVDKLRAYQFQDQGMDTIEANLALGHQADARDYGVGAAILKDLAVRSVRLLTNNPDKLDQLRAYGVTVNERVPLQPTPREENLRYLATKVESMRHEIDLPQPGAIDPASR
jgi:3,4-dihydroxy 2-butanone 4-phosphate synthase/GTP cyclohydrolase II